MTQHKDDDDAEKRMQCRNDDAEKAKTGSCCARCCYHLNHPKQVSERAHRCVGILGRVGFTIKGLLYGFIGYLCLKSSLGRTVDHENQSPQGVFIFIMASYEDSFARTSLSAIFCGIAIYAIWRFWEGTVGQGYDETFSHKKNFFRYRLSPYASGLVYTLYDLYIIYVITRPKPPPNSSAYHRADASCFPLCWKSTTLGMVGLALLAIAFTIAMITQLIETFTKKFHSEMNTKFFDENDKFCCVRRTIQTIFYFAGHVGFAGRSLYFGMVAYMFWVVLCGDLELDPHLSTVGQAVTAVQETRAGKALVTALGVGLFTYGFYAILCVIFRYFPTPPPIEAENDAKPSQKERNNEGHHHRNDPASVALMHKHATPETPTKENLDANTRGSSQTNATENEQVEKVERLFKDNQNASAPVSVVVMPQNANPETSIGTRGNEQGGKNGPSFAHDPVTIVLKPGHVNLEQVENNGLSFTNDSASIIVAPRHAETNVIGTTGNGQTENDEGMA